MIKVLLIFLFALHAYAFTIERSYTVAHTKALKEDKILLVFLNKKECSYCKNELIKLLENKKITPLIEKKTIFVIVTKNQKESYPIEMLYTTAYPTLFFLDKHELFHCEALRGEIEIEKIRTCIESK